MSERVCVIVNPAAGRGRGAAMIPQLTAAFAQVGVTDVRTTAGPGEELDLANAAIADGFTTIVAVGGDGTSGNVANALLHGGRHVRLGVMPAGTGNDFAKVLGTSNIDPLAMARLAVTPSAISLDVGRVEETYFLNCCGFGFDVAVLQELNKTKWLRGSSVYIWAALRQLFRYSGFDVSVGAGNDVRSDFHMMLVIANGPFFGGTFKIAPSAALDDGMLDAVSILDIPVGKRLSMLRSAIKGTHEGRPEVVIRRSDMFEVSFHEAPWYETDGELHRAQSSTLRIISCAAALRVVAYDREGTSIA
ncbi:MAG TPA: diacylglycerol kinase family protein [Gemmatimonadaceae bacterium]|nr:diacylglycerol kinase family protein [Gemmatimonadaceae bacterium]